MARTVSFDRDAVVRAARTVFWQAGYDASVPALEQATGLGRSSIYNTFGSKRGLFDAAVQSYLDEVVRPRLQPLTQDAVPPDAIVAYLTGLRGAFLKVDSPAASNGCLLINAAGTPIAHDQHVAHTIAAYRDEMRAALGRGVAAHRPDDSADVQRRISDAVTGLVVAAFALVRIDRSSAADNIDAALGLIDAGA